ncbi:MAG TPA: kelch repeat-containing protein [Saccharofermentans sp.]|nr:kelch repeat-containing protein [Saccharofermentans sp.]
MKDNSYISIFNVTSQSVADKYLDVIVNPLFPDLPQIQPRDLRVFVVGGPQLIYGRDYILIEPNRISWNELLLDTRIGIDAPKRTTTIDERDFLAILWTDKGTYNISKSETFTITDPTVVRSVGYLTLADAPRDADDIHIEIQGSQSHAIYYADYAGSNPYDADYMVEEADPRKIWFKNFKMGVEFAYDIWNPGIGDTITITYGTDKLFGRRIRENHDLTEEIELTNGRIYLRDKVKLEGSVHAVVKGGATQIREMDFTVEDNELIWAGKQLERELFTGLPDGVLDHLEVVYHTDIGGLPVKSILEYANAERQGLCPRLRKYVRDIEYAQDYEVPSEFAIRDRIEKINTNIDYIIGPSANTIDPTFVELAKPIGIFGEISSQTVELSAMKLDPDTQQYTRLVTWPKYEQSAFFKPLEVSGEFLAMVSEPSAIVIVGLAEADLVIDDVSFVKSQIQGGVKHRQIEVLESTISASGMLLAEFEAGVVLGKVTMYIGQEFLSESSIYSIGVSGNTDFLVKHFRLDGDVGFFNRFEHGDDIIEMESKLLRETSAIYLFPVSATSLGEGSGRVFIDIFYDEYVSEYMQGFVVGTSGNPTTRLNFATDVAQVNSSTTVNEDRRHFAAAADERNNIYMNNCLNNADFMVLNPNIDLLSELVSELPVAVDYPTSWNSSTKMWFAGGLTSGNPISYIMAASFADGTFAIEAEMATIEPTELTFDEDDDEYLDPPGLETFVISGYSFGSARIDALERTYIIGGAIFDNNDLLADSQKIQAYDETTYTASETSYQLTEAKRSVRTTIKNNAIYILGGSASNTNTDTVEKIDLENGTISIYGSIPFAIRSGCPLKYSTATYYAAGWLNSIVSRSVLKFEEDSNVWSLAGAVLPYKDADGGWSAI